MKLLPGYSKHSSVPKEELRMRNDDNTNKDCSKTVKKTNQMWQASFDSSPSRMTENTDVWSQFATTQTDVKSILDTSGTSKSIVQRTDASPLLLPFFLRHKHITSFKSHPSLAQGQSLPYWFRGNFCGRVCFDVRVREFPLSAVASYFELRCQSMRLLLFHYRICPCFSMVT